MVLNQISLSTLTTLKAFVEDKSCLNAVFDMLENIVEKGENAGNQHFLLFPQYFLKASFSGSFKVKLYGKELTLSSIYTHFNALTKKALGKHCGKR